MAIRTFRDKGTLAIAGGAASKEARRLLPWVLHGRAVAKLALLNRARSLADLNLPGLRLEKLTGDRAGQYSIRINDQYRICFEWDGSSADNVEITDYH